MSRHTLPPTTHTVELDQIGELNLALRARSGAQAVIAGDLQQPASELRSATGRLVPATAVLVRLSVDGPPEYPYVHAHFTLDPSSSSAAILAEMHTEALRRLSHLFGLRHLWGV